MDPSKINPPQPYVYSVEPNRYSLTHSSILTNPFTDFPVYTNIGTCWILNPCSHHPVFMHRILHPVVNNIHDHSYLWQVPRYYVLYCTTGILHCPLLWWHLPTSIEIALVITTTYGLYLYIYTLRLSIIVILSNTYNFKDNKSRSLQKSNFR